MTTGKSLLQERNDLKMCDHEESLPVLETAKNHLVQGQVSTEHEEQLQSCCHRKTSEHELPDEEERCCVERTQLQPFWAVFHAMLEETSFVTHLHMSHPSLLYSWKCMSITPSLSQNMATIIFSALAVTQNFFSGGESVCFH